MPYLGNNQLPFDPTRTTPAPRDADRFSGNGSTVAFTLSRAVNKATDIEVFVENVQQEPLTAYDAVGTTLTFTGAPPSGTNNVYVVYRNFQSGAQVTMPDGSVTYSKLANNLRIFTTDNLTPNGNNAVFTLSEPPADANTVMVTVDGVVQRAPVHYTTSGSTITFTSNPPAGSNVHVRHLGFRTTTTVTQLAANSTISQPILQNPQITSQAVFAAGSNTVPSITTAGDTNTGIFFPAADTISITQGGVESVRFTGSAIQLPTGVNQRLQIGSASNYSFGVMMNGDDFQIREAEDDNKVRLRIKYNATSSLAGQLQLPIAGSSTLYNAYVCRAWVNFDGTTSPGTIRASGNVSSVTRNGTGDYTVNFSTSMPDANYAVATGPVDIGDGVGAVQHQSISTGSYRFRTRYNDATNAYNWGTLFISIFR